MPSMFTPPFPIPSKDDQRKIISSSELLLHHEGFPSLVASCARLKAAQAAVTEMQDPAFIYAPHRTFEFIESRQSPQVGKDVQSCVDRMKQQLSNVAKSATIVRHGDHQAADDAIGDAIGICETETTRIQSYLAKMGYADLMEDDSSEEKDTQFKTVDIAGAGGRGRAAAKGACAAAKYAKWQVDVLMRWVVDHKDYPFPTKHEVAELAGETGLSNSQIVNWVTNVRKRNRKATLEGGKKPHHFMDFLFLAHERDLQKLSATQQVLAIHGGGGCFDEDPTLSRKRKFDHQGPRQVHQHSVPHQPHVDGGGGGGSAIPTFAASRSHVKAEATTATAVTNRPIMNAVTQSFDTPNQDHCRHLVSIPTRSSFLTSAPTDLVRFESECALLENYVCNRDDILAPTNWDRLGQAEQV